MPSLPSEKQKDYTSKLLEAIAPEDALTILRQLAEEDPRIAKRIEEIASETLGSISVESLATEIQMELESLTMEDVWAAAGPTADGYVDPADAECEVLEEAMAPFQEQLAKYQQQSLHEEAKFCCMGILKGVYDFDMGPGTEYRDSAVDVAGEFFSAVLGDWRKGCNNRQDLAEMDEFIGKNCPDWG